MTCCFSFAKTPWVDLDVLHIAIGFAKVFYKSMTAVGGIVVGVPRPCATTSTFHFPPVKPSEWDPPRTVLELMVMPTAVLDGILKLPLHFGSH